MPIASKGKHSRVKRVKLGPPEKAQIERFKETARKLGADESGDTFERAFAKIVPPKPIVKPAET
jgi:hypothetical protein